MSKKILSVFLSIWMFLSAIPAFADNEEISFLFSSSFSSYAENETNISEINLSSGIDTRIISDNGNKALFSRAFGEPVSFDIRIPEKSYTEIAFSAKVKFEGKNFEGNIFNLTCGTNLLSLFNIAKDGRLTLFDGKPLGGISRGHYKTYTALCDITNQTVDIYIDGKSIVKDYYLPHGTTYTSPTKTSFFIDAPATEEADVYVDDLMIYYSETASLHNSSIAKITPLAEIPSTQLLPFTPTDVLDTSSKIIAETSFNSLTEGVAMSGSYSYSMLKEDDGTTTLHVYSDANTKGSSYFDITGDKLEITPKYVIDMRFKINSLVGDGAAFKFFDTKNAAGAWRVGYSISSRGVVTSNDAGVVGKIKIGEWSRISIAYDLRAATASVYVNGEYSTTHSIRENYNPVFFRVDVASPIGQIHDSQIDWLRIYTGMELREGSYFHEEVLIGNTVTDEEVKNLPTVMDTKEKQLKAIDGKVVFMLTNEAMYIDGQKELYGDKTIKPYNINGTLMIPQSILARITDKEIRREGDSLKIGDAKLKVGESAYTLFGANKELSCAPYEKYGEIYIPLKSVAEQILGKIITYDNRGMVIMADNRMTPTSNYMFLDRYFKFNDIDLIYRYMQFENPTGDEMIADVVKRFPQNKHPRILYTDEDIAYILERVNTDAQWKEAYDAAIADALSLTGISYAGKNANVPDSRKQSVAANCTPIVTKLSTAYLLTGDEIYAQKGIEVMKELAAWETLGYTTSQLTTGDWALTMAIGLDSFYNYMMKTDEGKEDFRYFKDRIKALTYYDHITSYAGVGGLTYFTMQDNFLGYVSGAVLPLTLALCDEDDMRAQSSYIMENAMKSLEINVGLFFPNGGYYEAISYSAYSFSHFIYGLNALFNCCGTDYGFGYAKGFKDAGDFFTYVQSIDYNFGFHDANNITYRSNAIRELMAYRYGEYDQAIIADKWYQLTGNKKDLYTLFLYSRAMDNGGYTDITTLPLDYYFYGAELGAFTNSRAVSDPVFAGFHGGWNGIPHSMLDLGEFIFESDGVRWATDLGSDSYSLPNYFSNQGYRIYRKRPEGENCLVINPASDENYYGQKIDALAELVDYESKSRGAKAAYDLSQAYERDVEKYIRGYYFGDDRSSYTVQDELTLRSHSELYWFMHTPAEITIVDNTKAILTSPDGTKSLTVDVYCNVPGYSLEVMDAKPLPTSPVVVGQNANNGISKLTIHAPEAFGKVTISVKLSPNHGEEYYTPLTVNPISEWTIPDGELVSTPEFDAIYLDGSLIEGFASGKHSYEITLAYEAAAAPVVSAAVTDGTVDIKQAADTNDRAVLTIKKDGARPVTCTIQFTLAKLPSVTGQSGEIIPVSADAETMPEPQNGPANLLDSDFETRCTQLGLGLSYDFDLGEVMDISGVKIAFYMGDKRNAYFEMLYSEDGMTYKTVFSGQSGGMTAEYETFNVPGRARYIRIIGNGNSESNWNNIAEFRAFR